MRGIQFYLLLLFAVFFQKVSAQEKFDFYPNYGTMEVMNRLVKEQPEIAEQRKAIEEFTNEFLKNEKFEESVIVPVVFHIVQGPKTEEISPETIYSQIEALNRDFGEPDLRMEHKAMTKEGFAERAASVGISFCLPTETPDGKPTTGVNFYQTETSVWTTDDAVKSKEIVPWNTKNYLNIYVTALEKGLMGYAQMPGGPVESDGIVIDYRFFGKQTNPDNPYNMGKTLTHLIGNYLNLYPLWGGTPCQDDYVSDTPIHNAPNSGCSVYKHRSLCGNKESVEMTMNFMDSSFDECKVMFTKGQKERMYAAFAPGGPREGLLETGLDCEGKKAFEDIADRTTENSETEEALINANIFPNPAKERLNIVLNSLNPTGLTLIISGTLGNKIYENKLNVSGSFTQSIDCRNWQEGLYHLMIQDDNGKQITKTFNIQH